MTVKELIVELSAMPGDLELYMRDTTYPEQDLISVDFMAMGHEVTEEDDIMAEEGTDIVILEY
ncbi:MAG: hypothetical protein WC261_08310 [Synergistaceae bacterium]|jgi:hypothetical protein